MERLALLPFVLHSTTHLHEKRVVFKTLRTAPTHEPFHVVVEPSHGLLDKLTSHGLKLATCLRKPLVQAVFEGGDFEVESTTQIVEVGDDLPKLSGILAGIPAPARTSWPHPQP